MSVVSNTTKPVIPKVTVKPVSDFHGSFIVEPLEPGFGHTIGNALRRTILSFIKGYAITNMKLLSHNVHEFDTIEGVAEDVTEMILNLKEVALRGIGEELPEGESKLNVSISGKKVFKAADLIQEGLTSFEVLNPEHVICHLDENVTLNFEFTVRRGEGYVPAEEFKTDEIGTVALDALYSPVKNVNFRVEKTLVGKSAEFERLIIEVTTDGTVTTEEVLRQSSTILKTHFFILSGNDFLPEIPVEKPVDQLLLQRQRLLQTNLSDVLSTRASNGLSACQIYTVGDVIQYSLPELMKVKRFGKQSIKEVEKYITGLGLSFASKPSPSRL